ncbi:MAG: OmpA family protein, partial [Gemmatimonadaceae bacterium]|nr:OmpA family protein [Acetobacteraceae bacterium]
YLVFFDWDRADLTDRARQIVAEAATASTRAQVTRIEVAGHADRSGSDTYNLGLSRRRAQAVSSELVRLGVPRAAITTQGFGERNPLVQTADGVREPQNRRVEIVLR